MVWEIKVLDNIEQRQEEVIWRGDELAGGEERALQQMGVESGSVVQLWEMKTMDFAKVRKELVGERLHGVVLFVYFDDLAWVMARDGKIVGAFYSSNRGPLFQSEWAWETEEGRKFGWGNNLVDGKWGEEEQFGDWETTLAIAGEFLDSALKG